VRAPAVMRSRTAAMAPRPSSRGQGRQGPQPSRAEGGRGIGLRYEVVPGFDRGALERKEAQGHDVRPFFAGES
jgi:hypothetical protein